jgi:hypothetical protein
MIDGLVKKGNPEMIDGGVSVDYHWCGHNPTQIGFFLFPIFLLHYKHTIRI